MAIRKTHRAKKKPSHNILIVDPQPNTLASYILLKKELRKLDIRFEESRKYLGLRWEFLNKSLIKNGDLICEFCGRQHLDIGLDDLISCENNKINSNNKNLATIDHFFPIKHYPSYYLETRNWVISCRTCNGKKGSSNPFKWLRKNNIRFHIPNRLNDLINSNNFLITVRDHLNNGYRTPEHYEHIENMIRIHKKVA